MVSPPTAREGECLHREKKEVERARVNKKSMAFPWLSSRQEEEKWSSSCLALLLSRGTRTPPSGLPALFN